jgi:hypothetical protein
MYVLRMLSIEGIKHDEKWTNTLGDVLQSRSAFSNLILRPTRGCHFPLRHRECRASPMFLKHEAASKTGMWIGKAVSFKSGNVVACTRSTLLHDLIFPSLKVGLATRKGESLARSEGSTGTELQFLPGTSSTPSARQVRSGLSCLMCVKTG